VCVCVCVCVFVCVCAMTVFAADITIYIFTAKSCLGPSEVFLD